MQLPALGVALLLGPILGATLLAIAALLTYRAVPLIHSLWRVQPRSRTELATVLMPFFAWWTACAVFLVLVVPALLLVLLGVSSEPVFLTVGGVSLAAGLRSVLRRPRVMHVPVPYPGLPPELVGYRIAHISDLHCGPFSEGRRVEAWVRRVNQLETDLVAVTGDLVVSGTSYVDAVARGLGGLRARDGAFVCMGNHDYFGGAGEHLVRALEAQGLTVLRNRWQAVPGRDLVVAGVDDTWTGRHDMAATLANRPSDAFTLLLAHDPDLFPEAASRQVELTLSGHTHGGQVGVPFLARRWNLARLAHRLTVGLYRQGESALYVNRGLGTTGPPLRFGVPAEITILTLLPSA